MVTKSDMEKALSYVRSVKMEITKLHPDAQIPVRQHEYDAGLDLSTIADVTVYPGTQELVPLGIAIAVPRHHAGFIVPRSGLAAKHGITVTNSPGIIDSEFSGELKVILRNTGNYIFDAKAGERIAQLLIVPVPTVNLIEVESLDQTSRGEGGFGSTGT